MKSVSLYKPLSVMDEFLESFFDSPLAPFVGSRVLNKLPLVDVQETGNAYLVEAELPGLDEKQIKVQMDGGKLTIESEQEEQNQEEKNGSYLIRERRRSSFSRSFTLPENADPESVSAVFKNGVLSLEIKKRTESAKRLIEINAQ
ncbi:MAG: Hsp20/alpha crystallin family protein [Spirochaetaceae bacterium]|jgi:HSP20 family protein|nr:Hsp20/alpha crystallin family protein [Spirochaetaceae bacterium]